MMETAVKELGVVCVLETAVKELGGGVCCVLETAMKELGCVCDGECSES